MTGRKRASNTEESSPTTRTSKAAKTDAVSTPSKSKKGSKKGPKPAIPTTTFKATALPLHVNLTHTPPTIADPDSEAISTAVIDPGFIGNLTLVPSTFATGSYGWKGNKRLTVELQNEGKDEKEKVQVMLTINATVVGSKQAKSGDDDEETKDLEEETAEVDDA